MSRKEVSFMEDKVFVSIFAPYMDLWVEDRKAHGFQCKSAIGNLRQIDMYIASNPPQGFIDQSYYEGWLDSVRVPEASTKAVYSKAATFRQFLKFLKALGINDFIPRLPRCKDNFFVPYIFSHEEIQAIFQAIDSTAIRSEFNRTSLMSMPVLFRLLYSTGMRVGEAVSICNKDVDFQHHVILIEESKNRHQRICPINKSLQEVIQGYIRYRNMLPMKKVSLPDSPLLVNRCGHSLNINTVERWFRESLRKAGIPYRGHFAGPRIHDLRHTACVHAMIKLAGEGMDLYCSLPVLSKFLGHLDAYSTERYLRLTQEVYPDIINKVNLSLPEIKAIVERTSKTEHWHEDN